jgi:flagellar basal-body rod protein FlgB
MTVTNPGASSMDLRNIPLFGALTRRMAWLNQRQQILAHNVANSDTPGFRPKDLKPVNFADQLDGARRLKLAITAPSHKSEAEVTGGKFRDEAQKVVYEESPDENAVNVEEQMLKVAEARIDYETMTTLYKKHVDMVKTALGTRK